MTNFPILVKTPLTFQSPWAPAPFPKREVRALIPLIHLVVELCPGQNLSLENNKWQLLVNYAK